MHKGHHSMVRFLTVMALPLALGVWAANSSAEKSIPPGKQAADGAKLYKQHCAECHGKVGQGTKKAPAVVGKDALPLDPPAASKMRTMQFRTAQDVAQFVATKMPGDKPGSLTTEQYYDIMAFDLKANGVDVSMKKIDATTAAEIKLH